MVSHSRKADLNTATFNALLLLPQVGPSIASAIISGRPYRRIDDLRQVSGIGEKLYFVLKAHVTISQAGIARAIGLKSEHLPSATASSAKLDLNRATVQELTALPHVGRTLAEAIVGARPYIRLPELRLVKGVGSKLYEALRQHLRVPRNVPSIIASEYSRDESVPSAEKRIFRSAVEIEPMPSFDEKDHNDTEDAYILPEHVDPLEVDTVQELIGPRIVDGQPQLRVDPDILEAAAPYPPRLVTRELRRDWKSVEIEIGSRSRGTKWRLLVASVIAALLLSALQAYGFLGDLITPDIFSPSATDYDLVPAQTMPSVSSNQDGVEPTTTVVAFTESVTSLPATTEMDLSATLQPSTVTDRPTIAARIPLETAPSITPVPSITSVPSVTPAPTATMEIQIPQSVSDLDPTVMPIAVLWAEDFEPIRFPWGYDQNEFWESGIVDGALRLNMKQRGKLFYSTGPTFQISKRDFLYEGDVIVEACIGKDFFGLLFKAELPDYYAATITCEGNYRLAQHQSGDYEDLRVAASGAVPAGPGVHRLGVLLQRDGFSLYVNGMYVDSLPVDGLDEVTSGEFGVFARSVESHQLQLAWDNLIATELQR